MQPHPARKITYIDGSKVSIDVKLIPLMKALWALGLETTFCCQETYPGAAEICFLDARHIVRFIEAADEDYFFRAQAKWGSVYEGEKVVRHFYVHLWVIFPAADIPRLARVFRKMARGLIPPAD